MSQKERNERCYKKRKENGLCPRCGKPLDREGHYCSKCVKYASEQTRQNREFYRKHGLCPRCGKNKLFGEEKTCPECLAKEQKRRDNFTEEQKQKYIYKHYEKNKKRKRDLYKERIEKGICTKCGIRKSANGKRKCSICQEKENEYKRNRRNKGIARSERPKYSLCYLCGKPLDREGGLCKKCAESQTSHLPKTHGSKAWIDDNKLLFKH